MTWRPASLLAALLLGISGVPAGAYDGVVEKRVFEMPSYTTQGGRTIRQVRVGWEAYGTLNAARDNAVLVTHFFSGNSHAAGKYAADDKVPGYWDTIIGPGKPIDTDRFYVISSDTLVNLNTGDPKVVTTGPATVNPDTGRPYGADFPVVTIRDFVEVQKALLDSLGIARLHAVIGPSMGALQALEWASAYPDRVGRVVPVIGAGEADPFLIGWLNAWAAPIRLDPNWNGGDYYGRTPPNAGLKEALKLVTLQANHWEWANTTWGRAWAEEGRNPVSSLAAQYKVEAALDAASAARAAVSDANHFLYLVKANQAFSACHCGTIEEGLKRITAKSLVIYSPRDLVFNPAYSRRTAEQIAADGTPAETAELSGNRGHLEGVANMQSVGPRLKAFLEP